MTSGNNGAVFFLGTRAHYQVLSAPETKNYDIDNGNTSTETLQVWPEDILDNKNIGIGNTEDTIIDVEEKLKDFDFGDGVKRRLKKRNQDGSNEMIINDNDEYQEFDPSMLNSLDNDNNKTKPKRGRLTLPYFLTLLARRKKSVDKHCLKHLDVALVNCSYRDSCRCLDCQSRYFDCDESDEDYSDSECHAFDSTPDESPQLSDDEENDVSEHLEKDASEEEGDDEVFIEDKPAVEETKSTDNLITEEAKPRPTPSETESEEGMLLELAAGAPVFFDHLLNHPITCTVQ